MGSPPAEPPPRTWTFLGSVLVLTALVQGWTLSLSFQLDDYALLWRPLELFRLGTEHETAEVPRFALRWTSWALWALLDGVLPTPRTELPYHLVGLGLHLVCTGLVFAIARRLVPAATATDAHAQSRPRPSGRGPVVAGALAALWFGVQAGPAQAHSWISAWGGLTAAVCSLLALRAFVVARERDTDARLAARLPLALWTLLALLSKTPALAVPPLLVWLALCLPLEGLAGDPGGRRRRAREVGAALGALAAGLAIRAAYLGNARPRYGDRRPLDVNDLPRVLSAGLENLGQGIVATNHDPLVADRSHLFTAGWAPWVGVGLLLAVFGLWLASAPRRWRTALGLFGALVAAGGPAGAIYGGVPNNVMARTTYFPLALFALAVGAALVAGAGRSTRPVRRLALAALVGALVAVAFAGHRDVVHVERLADAERRQHRATLEAAARRVGDAGLVVLREPPDGFVGVPQLGSLLHGVLLPTFWGGPRPELERCTNDRQLRAALDDGRLRGRTVAVVVPRGDIGGGSPAELRAARALVDRWGRAEAWPLGPQAGWCRVERGEGETLLRFDRPMPPFGFAGLSFVPEAPGPVRIAYLDPEGRERAALELDVAPGPPVPVAAPRALEFRLGGALGAVRLSGVAVGAPRILFELPTVEVDAAWMAGELELDRDRPLPPIAIAPPEGWSLPPIARLTMRVERTVGETEVYADSVLAPEGSRPAPFLLELVHIEPDARPGDPAVFRATWPQAVDRLRELIENAEGAPSGAVTWLVELLHPDGTPAAAGRPVTGRYRLSEAP